MTIKKYFWKKVRDFDTKQLSPKELFYFKEMIYLKRGEKISAGVTTIPKDTSFAVSSSRDQILEE